MNTTYNTVILASKEKMVTNTFKHLQYILAGLIFHNYNEASLIVTHWNGSVPGKLISPPLYIPSFYNLFMVVNVVW